MARAKSRTQRTKAASGGRATRPSEPPRDLRASRLRVDGDELVVFSFVSDAGDLSDPLQADAPLALLTPPERETVRLALEGRSNAEIARERGVATATVAKQLERVYRKLSVNSRAELAARLHRVRP